MHLIVTRPEEDATKLIAKLESMGHSGSAAPMICISNLPGVILPQRPWQAILVTSANSVRALSTLEGGNELTSVPVLAVGPASTDAARAAGFSSVRTAAGDLKALTALAVQHLDPAMGPLFYPSGTVISGDLKAHLEGEGFTCVRTPLYEAVPATELPAAIVSEIKKQSADGVVLYSPRTARTWAKCLATAGLLEAASSLTHCCLSTAVADALHAECRGGPRIENLAIAPEPNEDSLLEVIGVT